MKLFVLFSFFLFSLNLLAQEFNQVQMDRNFSLWSRPYFNNTYVVDSLPAGTKGEIIGYQKKSQGYGIEIRITTGPDTGKTGWVYYPIEKARRKLKLLDKEGHSVSSPSENMTSFMQDFSKQQQLLDESRKKISSLKATDSDIKDIDNVWLNIYEGNYLIDTEHDDGGAFLPILRKVQNGNDQPKIERFYVPRSYERILAMTSHLNLSLDLSQSCHEKNFSKKNLLKTIEENKYSKGCLLLSRPSNQWKTDELYQCLNSLREKIGGNKTPIDRKKMYEALYALSPEEQEFIGSVLTLYGESRSSTDEESFIVLKTFDNRKKTAQKSCKNANLLDVVLQNKQFSMWNQKDPNWKKAVSLKEEEKAPPEKAGEKYQLKRMIDVYKKFKNDEFHVPKVYEPSTNRITHYRTRAMDYSPSSVPSWGAASDSLRTIVVNRVNIGATNKKKAQVDHYFFEDIAWRFKYHPYRPKKTGEGKCY